MMKLLIIKNYLLLIDEKAEIKAGDIVVHNFGMGYELEIPCDKDNLKSNTRHKVVAYYPLTKEAEELDLPLLPNLFKEVDFKNIVEDLPEHDDLKSMDGTYSSFHYQSEAMIKGYELGYKAAQAKQFSLEDIISFGRLCFYEGLQRNLEDSIIDIPEEDLLFFNQVINENELIQSLSTQQFPKEFIPEYKEVTCGYDSIPHNVIRTITNSEGRRELVGTYKY